MALFNKDQKLVERKEGVPGYNRKNKTDRKIARYVIIGLFIVAVLIIMFVLLYYWDKIF